MTTLRTRATLLIGSSFTIMAAAAIAPALPNITHHFRDVPNADLLTRLLLTIVGLSIALTAPAIGLLLDRIGRKPVLVAALLIYVLAGTSGLYLTSLPALMLSRAILGIGVAGLMTSLQALAADLFQGQDRSRFITQQSAFSSLGGALFIPLAGFLATLSWRAPFFTYLLPLLLIPFALRLPHTQAVHQAKVQLGRTFARIPWTPILTGYAAVFLFMLVFYLAPSQLPFHLSHLGIPPLLTGVIMGAGTLASGISGLLYARQARQTAHARAAALGLLLMVIGWAGIAYATQPTLIVLSLLVGSLGAGVTLPNLNAWIAHLAPSHARGRLIAGLASSTFLGQFLSPVAAQPLVHAHGIPTAFACGTVLMAALSAALFAVPAQLGTTQPLQASTSGD